MQSWRVERQAWCTLCLVFSCFYSSFFIVPYFYGFISAGCSNQRLPNANIHASNRARMVMQVDWLKCKFNCIFVVFVFNLACHKHSVCQKNQHFIFIHTDRTDLHMLVIENVFLFVCLVLVFVYFYVFICQNKPLTPIRTASCCSWNFLLYRSLVVDY